MSATVLALLVLSFPPSGSELFESRIRPALVEHCYRCHHSHGTAKAGLALDSREGIRRASASGTAVVPGRPEESLLLRVIRHEVDGLEMPRDGARLGDDVVADFERWIRAGAHDPRDAPPSKTELTEATSWSAILARRKQWWSHQPIRDPDPPASSWSAHPIDRFVHRRMTEQGLAPAAPADRRTLIRRLTFAVTGLPPTRAQIEWYLADRSPAATDELIDRLLASPHYGERWARHWMDLVRYAGSHGSEGDPTIPNAWRYRDYLIRAFNQDVPYDQLVLEHVAGDLLPSPRIDVERGVDESAIGPAHWRMVFHGFAPTDALDEKVRFVDDQINVFGKAFLGLTISCARCHDHKFDAISQDDYYALFGILGSCRPAMRDVNTEAVQERFQDELARIKGDVRDALTTSWLASTETLAERLLDPDGGFADRPGDALRLVAEVERRGRDGVSLAEAWRSTIADWKPDLQPTDRADEFRAWFADGNGLEDAPTRAGAFAIEPEGANALTGIYPAGAYTHLLSTRHRGVLGSPRLALDDELEAWLLVAGGGKATARFVVQNYPRGGTVYPIHELTSPDWSWHRFDLSYWKGDEIHFELVTARDAPVEVRGAERSWFGVREVVVQRRGGDPPRDPSRRLAAPMIELAGGAPATKAALIERFVEAVRVALRSWRDDATSDAEALLLDACLRDGVLPNGLGELPVVRPVIEAYRDVERRVPTPTRVPGLAEADAFDQPLLDRGDHREPLAAVPRRFLEVIDGSPYDTAQSGRLELARDLLREDNTLTARVIVNRLWHHLFGRGIVATPDNFGRLGATPSHPELLDHLATRMIETGWSIKSALRYMLTSKTWQLASDVDHAARDVDPDNRWLSRASTRRLDAEAIKG